MSKTCIYCHIVFATKHRRKSISLDRRPLLYNYIKSIIDSTKSVMIKIGGISDHIHILINLHPDISLSALVKSVKQSSSLWLHRNINFPHFDKWQSGYFAGSVGPDGVERCKKYIENQEQHHLKEEFISEMEWMINKYELQWYKEDWD